jgi:hypothetical protein
MLAYWLILIGVHWFQYVYFVELSLYGSDRSGPMYIWQCNEVNSFVSKENGKLDFTL